MIHELIALLSAELISEIYINSEDLSFRGAMPRLIFRKH